MPDDDDILVQSTTEMVALAQRALATDIELAQEYGLSVLSLCAITLRHPYTRFPVESKPAIVYLMRHFKPGG